ncbi:MAG: PHP domain-containing protein [Vicinamibacteria bacterium]
MRCDLHVHTRYSGPTDLPLLRHLSRECYSDPADVYRIAKARGMDLVTITDHDTIEGALHLAHLPDFIVGEEVTCEITSGLSWIGTGRLIFSLNYTDAEFEAVMERFESAALNMNQDGWWAIAPGVTAKSLHRRLLRELAWSFVAQVLRSGKTAQHLDPRSASEPSRGH